MPKWTAKEIGVKNTARKASELPVKYQLKLKKIEKMIRAELDEDDDPKMDEEVRHMLRRQLVLKSEDAWEMYTLLEAERPENLRRDAAAATAAAAYAELEKKHDEKQRTGPKPTPSTAKATPLDPSNPPPGPSQGLKRRQTFDDPRPAKKGSSFVPCVGDWHCGTCKHWNMRWFSSCQGLDGTCVVKGWEDGTEIKVQQEGEGVPPARKSNAKRQGDWACRCLFWNRSHWRECGRCKGSRKDSVGQDLDEDLPEDPRARDHDDSYPASDDYWGGELHAEALNDSSASRQRRIRDAPNGTLGRYQEKKKKQ